MRPAGALVIKSTTLSLARSMKGRSGVYVQRVGCVSLDEEEFFPEKIDVTTCGEKANDGLSLRFSLNWMASNMRSEQLSHI